MSKTPIQTARWYLDMFESTMAIFYPADELADITDATTALRGKLIDLENYRD